MLVLGTNPCSKSLKLLQEVITVLSPSVKSDILFDIIFKENHSSSSPIHQSMSGRFVVSFTLAFKYPLARR